MPRPILTVRAGLITVAAIIATISDSSTNSAVLAVDPSSNNVLDIGSRRELFVDRFLIDSMTGVELRLHEPRLAAQLPDAETVGRLQYGTVIKDGDLFRLYTRDARGAKSDGDTREVTRYYESQDGIHWKKPALQLFEVDGTKENNVILHEPFVCHNFSPFLDKRPGTIKEQRFKALAGVHPGGGLVAFTSADGIHWKKLQDDPVVTSRSFAFDSQNVSFWSKTEQLYVCYFRSWKTPHGQLRTISRTTSSDYLTWSEPVSLHPNFPDEHLYTSQTHPYFRAPHIYIATPTRFHPKRGNSTDIMFMTARGNSSYDRTFRQAFIRPGLDPERWGNRSNYAVLNVVPTGPQEMSIYTTPFRRFTLRTDGFASLNAGADVGEMRTHLLRFEGQELEVNYATSAGGSVKVEIQDAAGKALPGFALEDCKALVGDSIRQIASWTSGKSLSTIAGKSIRVRFVMQDADLFSLKFNR